MADALMIPVETEKPKKRKILGSIKENSKKGRLSNHQTGEDCRCVRYKFFETTAVEDREFLIAHFNGLPSKDSQDSLLSGLITVNPVKRRRSRDEVEAQQFHDHSYSYTVKVQRENKAVPVTVCSKAFQSIFGVTKSRIDRIKTSLASTGLPPQDKRGKHANRPHAFKEDQTERIARHIKSFRGRSSHYSLKDTRKLYLPEDLNVHKMFEMYMEQNPQDKCCYESYRKVFVQRFNIAFGYPRKDTCSDCDAFNVKLASQETDEHARVRTERELHLRKAHIFYERNSRARQDAQVSPTTAAIAFDFWKICAALTFQPVSLEDNSVALYAYDETIGKKGADDVTSMLRHFVTNFVPQDVTHLKAFCDSCAGQNKNWTMLRFLHSLVHVEKRFNEVKLSFPVKGHSYMECDRDMVCINQKARVEVPEQWRQLFETSRSHPAPFQVVHMREFLSISNYLKPLYRAACPIQTRPLREILFTISRPHEMPYRVSWNGGFQSVAITKRGKRTPRPGPLVPLYPEPLGISAAKFKDLQVLKRFCAPEAQQYYSNLPCLEETEGSPDVSDEDDA